MKLIQLLSILLFLVSCSGGQSGKCSKIDWQQVGHEDAKSGKGVIAYSGRVGLCVGSGDKDAYQRGYKDGRVEFCTKKGVFRAGLRGHRYIHPCDNKKLRSYFQKGRNIFITRNRIEDAVIALDELVQKYKYSQHSNDERKEMQEDIQLKRRSIRLEREYLSKELDKYRRFNIVEEGE